MAAEKRKPAKKQAAGRGQGAAAKKAKPATGMTSPGAPSRKPRPSGGRKAKVAAKAPARRTTTSRSAAPPPRKKAVAGGDAALRALQEENQLLKQEKDELQDIARRMRAERDSALAEEKRLADRMREIESEQSRRAGPATRTAGPGGFDPSLDLEEDEPETSAEDELEGAAGFFDRIDEIRARRTELDRERADRELEQSDQAFWMICPKCGELMEEQESENIKLERCDNCGGLYLDRGEVDLLLTVISERESLPRLHSILKF